MVGVDLDRLTGARTIQGARVGSATLRGTWQDGVITVTGQSAPAAPGTVPTLSDKPPCAPPPDGWLTGSVDPRAVEEFVRHHPDRFGELWIGWPDGFPSAQTGPPDYRNSKQVLVVGVITGDLAAARREIEAVYRGNLCVQRAPFSLTEIDRVRSAAARLEQGGSNGVFHIGEGTAEAAHLPLRVQFMVLDQHLYDAFAVIGFRFLSLEPIIRPVR